MSSVFARVQDGHRIRRIGRWLQPQPAGPTVQVLELFVVVCVRVVDQVLVLVLEREIAARRVSASATAAAQTQRPELGRMAVVVVALMLFGQQVIVFFVCRAG